MFELKYSLKYRILKGQFLLSVFLMLLVSFMGLMLMYYVEDEIFYKQMDQQIVKMKQSSDPITWKPNIDNMFISWESLPKSSLQQSIWKKDLSELNNERVYFHRVFSKHDNQSFVMYWQVNDLLMVRKNRNFIVGYLFLTILIGLIIGGFISYLFAKRLSHPIENLSKILNNTPNHIPQSAIEKFKQDEIGQLVNQLNQYLKENIQFINDRKQFNNDISHELRTPISIIKNAVEICEIQGVDHPVFSRIKRANETMERISDCFLWLLNDVNRTESCQSKDVIDSLEMLLPLEFKKLEIAAIDITIDIPKSVMLVLLLNQIYSHFEHRDVQSGVLELNEFGVNLITKGEKSVNDEHHFGLGSSISNRICERFNITKTIEIEEFDSKLTLIW